MFKNLKIRTKLLVVNAVLAMIAVFTFSYVGIHTVKKTAINTQITMLENIATLKVEKIESFFKERVGDIKIAQHYFNVKNNLPIVSKFPHDRTNPEYIIARKMLDDQIKIFINFKYYVNFMMVSPEGKVVYSANKLHEKIVLDNFLEPTEGEKAFKEGKNGIYFSDIYRNQLDGYAYRMLITAPALDFDGKFIGVIAIELDMEPIYKFMQDTTGLGETGETLIAKSIKDGALFLNILRYDKDAALKRKAVFGRGDSLPILNAVRNKNGAGISIDYRGKDIIAAWRHIPLLDWGLVAKIDLQEVFVNVKNLKVIIFYLLVVIIVLAVTGSFWLSISITIPVKKLSETMLTISRGEAQNRVEIKSKDEIGLLAGSFNMMSEKLQASRNSLKESEKRYRTLVLAIPDIVFKIDKNGYFTFVNLSIKNLGYEPDELIGKHLSMIFDQNVVELISRAQMFHGGGDSEKPWLSDQSSHESMKIRDLKIRLFSKFQNSEGGKMVCLGLITIVNELATAEHNKYSVSKNGKKIVGAIGIVRDITEKTKFQNEAIRSRQLAILGELSATVAHEVNTPINSITNCAQMLCAELETKNIDVDKGLLYIIINESDRITNVIKSLLLFAGDNEKSTDYYNVKDLLLDVITLTRIELKRDGIEVKTDLDFVMPEIVAHPQQIQQVFFNIINNAQDALSEKYSGFHENKIIELKGRNVTRDNRSYAQIEFCDHGIGIPADKINNVMITFFTTKPRGKGTGLGLSITNKIIRDHDGELKIESVEGEHTKVIILLPVDKK